MATPISKISPQLFDNIQYGFVDAVQKAFETVQSDATNLLYVLAALEIALFGLAWAIRQEEAFGLLLLKVVKIGFFFMFILYFPSLVNYLMKGFLLEAYNVASDKGAIFLFHPGKVWEIGFKAGVSMMKLSVEYGTYNIGMSLIYLILGFGLLVMFALIGAQIILVVVLFYLLMMLTLIIMPLGLIKPMEGLFYKAAQSLFKAGARVFTITIILGVSFPLWKAMKLENVSQATGLEKPLGLFFLTLIILFLLSKLPAIMADSIGKLGGNIFDGMFGNGSPSVNVNVASPAGGASFSGHGPVGSVSAGSSMAGGYSGAASGSSISAATTVVSGGSSGGGGSTGSGAPASTSVTVNSTANAASVKGPSKGAGVDQASNVSISKQTLSQIQNTVKQAMGSKDS